MRLFYSIAIHLYNAAIYIAALFNLKARQWVQGRRNVFSYLEKQLKDCQHIVWFHCASLGEFEQGKPVMQQYRLKHPDSTILVTFFSPSGYEIKKNDSVADVICYLPSDTMYNATRFMRTVHPEKAVFVKYEYWYNYIYCLAAQNVPFYYISAIFRPSQYFFKPYGKWFAHQLQKCSCFFVQNEYSKQLLASIGIIRVKVTGDTRFDRVYDIARQNYDIDFIHAFANNQQKIIVAGSTWAPDEHLLKQLLSQLPDEYKLVLAPHVTDIKHITQIKTLFQEFLVVCYTEKTEEALKSARVLVIDTIGILSKLYKYSYISYVGGAFETGLHNTLEAAVFGVPLFFGPHYDKFNEAVQLVNRRGAFSITSYEEMLEKVRYYAEYYDKYNEVCKICQDFVQENLGSCEKILQTID